jgi:diguanylate cyclase (GGDEF)-like protein
MNVSSKPLLTLPTVAARLLTLTANPETSVGEVGKAIRVDPSLSAKVLRAVNSVQYSVGRPIADVDRAVILLGKRTVSTLALTFSLSDAVSRNKRLTKFFQQYWTESIVQAITAEILARKYCPSEAGQFFSAGLLQDLGRLYLLQHFGDDYAILMEVAQQGNQHLIDLEREAFETTHPDLAAEMLSQWQFPQQVVFAAAAHHKVVEDADAPPQDHFSLETALRIAALVGEYFCQSNKGVVHVMLQQALERCPEPKLTLDELTDQVHKWLAGMAALFNINTASLPSANEMLCEAMQQIAALTMSSEAADSMQTVRTELVRENNILRQRLQEVMHRIQVDPVTGVFTREVLTERLNKQIHAAAALQESIGLLFVDIDHFKKVNDVYGHVTGDKVLRHVAQSISSCVRGNDFAARYGGEEFVVVVGRPDEASLAAVAERVRQAIESHRFVLDRKQASVTASVGATLLSPVVAVSGLAERLVAAADAAMYEAKRQGRNRVVVTILADDVESLSTPHQIGQTRVATELCFANTE